jgi:hypothetical protein
VQPCRQDTFSPRGLAIPTTKPEVEEQERVKRLVPGRPRSAARGEEGEEAFDLLLGRPGSDRPVLQKRAVAPEPVDVGFFVLKEKCRSTQVSRIKWTAVGI